MPLPVLLTNRGRYDEQVGQRIVVAVRSRSGHMSSLWNCARCRLGDYLQEDCRHAIAHVRRKPGRTPLKFDDDEESARLTISSRVTEGLAEHYIRTELGVTESMYLVRRRGRGFPEYLDEAALRLGGYTGVREIRPHLLST